MAWRVSPLLTLATLCTHLGIGECDGAGQESHTVVQVTDAQRLQTGYTFTLI